MSRSCFFYVNNVAIGCHEALQPFAPMQLRKLQLLGNASWVSFGVAE
jgi:hypothetical protein